MITVYRENGLAMTTDGTLVEIEMRGLSTDEKPTENIVNGTVFIEIDTGKVFMFDGTSKTWKEI